MVTMGTTRTFLVGTAIGVVLSGAVYYTFSFVVRSAVSDIIISGTTLLGIGFSGGGYLFHWRGDNSIATYFITGLGVGIILVAFLGAGAGVDPLIGP